MTLVYYPLDENSLLKLVGTTLSTLKREKIVQTKKKIKKKMNELVFVI